MVQAPPLRWPCGAVWTHTLPRAATRPGCIVMHYCPRLPHSRRRFGSFAPFLYSEEFGAVVCDELLRWEAHLLQLLRVWRWDLSASNADRGSPEVVECIFGGQGNQLSADSKAGEARFHSHHVARLLHRLDDGLNIQRLDAAKVDDFSLDAILALELLSRDQTLANASGEGDDRQILARALDLRFAKLGYDVSSRPRLQRLLHRFEMTYRNNEIVALRLFAHLKRQAVQQLVLQHNDRVGVSDCGLQQTLGILCRVWRNDLEAWNRSVP